MTFADRLQHYQQLINDDIAEYSQQLLTTTEQEYGLYSREAIEAFTTILGRGGKRLRGALLMASYEMLGGTDHSLALTCARAMEMINAYVLILDDVADRSLVRRGGDAAHVLMRDYHEGRSLRGDSGHFGEATAIHAAVLGGYLAESVIDELAISAEVKVRLLSSLHRNLTHTFYGQLRDILHETLPSVSEQEALWVAEHKTAYYSLIKPLEMGAILAGASEDDLSKLRKFGLSAGIAFQITDDIIGIFGEQVQTGKSPLDDLREGKMTVLMTYALEHANDQQRDRLQSMLGDAAATQQDLDECRKILIDADALAHANDKAESLTTQAMGILDNAPEHWQPETVQFLRELTTFFVERKK